MNRNHLRRPLEALADLDVNLTRLLKRFDVVLEYGATPPDAWERSALRVARLMIKRMRVADS